MGNEIDRAINDDRKFFFTFYFITEKSGATEPKLYLVMEHYESDTGWYYNSGAIQGMARLGWREASDWFVAGLREGNIQDKTLVMPTEAQEIAIGMGLDVKVAHQMRISAFVKNRGYPPTILPTDAKYAERVKRAKLRP